MFPLIALYLLLHYLYQLIDYLFGVNWKDRLLLQKNTVYMDAMSGKMVA